MQLSPGAQQLRDLANKISRLNEYDTHADTGEPDHQIDTSELSRLKQALGPLVSDELQSRFMQTLNKMASGQPITFSESKLITAAFVSMADIIASDSSLISRMRKDIRDFNVDHEADDAEADIAADVMPDVELEEPYQPK
jgi:3-oxoacyl-ACP reductase-like protein